jgi:hypothetical protein
VPSQPYYVQRAQHRWPVDRACLFILASVFELTLSAMLANSSVPATLVPLVILSVETVLLVSTEIWHTVLLLSSCPTSSVHTTSSTPLTRVVTLTETRPSARTVSFPVQKYATLADKQDLTQLKTPQLQLHHVSPKNHPVESLHPRPQLRYQFPPRPLHQDRVEVEQAVLARAMLPMPHRG